MKRILWLDLGDCGEYTSLLGESRGFVFFKLPDGPLFPEGTEIAMGEMLFELTVKGYRYHLKSDIWLIRVDITSLDVVDVKEFDEYLDKEWTSDWPEEEDNQPTKTMDDFMIEWKDTWGKCYAWAMEENNIALAEKITFYQNIPPDAGIDHADFQNVIAGCKKMLEHRTSKKTS